MTEKDKKVPVKSEESKPVSSKRRWDSVLNLRGEIDHLFDSFQEGWPFERFGHLRKTPSFGSPLAFTLHVPTIDVVDKEKEVQINAELPGMDESDVEVTLSGRMLSISGEKKEEHEEGEKEGNYYLSERRYGSFKRSLSIPEGVDTDKVDASFKKGVLTVILPKFPEAQSKTKTIEIKGKD